MADGTAIDPSAFMARLARLCPPGKRLLAVSGGRDSMVLLDLCANGHYADQLAVATVDHGLRPSGAQEAEIVAGVCRHYGVAHTTLHWSEPDGGAGLQARARQARYRLLICHAEAIGARAILTAHTLDDQAETVLMRLARGSGVSGLSGMAPDRQVAVDGGAVIRLLRPLLEWTRADITATASARNLPYADDPSNDDPGFERVRVRGLLAATAERGLLDGAALTRSAAAIRDRLGDAGRDERRTLAQLGGVFMRWGGIELDAAAVSAPHSGIHPARITACLVRALYAVGAQVHPPLASQVGEAIARLGTDRRATLGGVLMAVEGARLRLYREPAGFRGRGEALPAAPAQTLEPGTTTLWDRRFILKNTALQPVTLLPCHEQGRDPSASGIIADPAVPALAAQTLPAVQPNDAVQRVGVRSLLAERFDGAVHRFVTPRGDP